MRVSRAGVLGLSTSVFVFVSIIIIPSLRIDEFILG